MNTLQLLRRLAPSALVAGLWVFSAGCDRDGEFVLAFSHEQHVKQEEIACDDCHKGKNGRFDTISHETCADCHEEWMDTKKVSAETCGKCHVRRDLQALAKQEPPASVPQAGGVFQHTASLTGRCASCHGELMQAAL